ncbi:Transcriptional regulator, AraC family [Candidatus Burkholderia verschuerenii]|uniref:Transcriptional regulator, AraC family n=1 Tax=Candidatus Burkholderia verschuerenii TaxID=242163 RepID=A0A0L0M5I1_9BURK|nr:helix-turn-helix domain-containing protein [Candidatus Burkholderia verschuerenii]KND57613.1 Transcriptional regulator, AraC family [Candidatus Burkholderia verschuerenii]
MKTVSVDIVVYPGFRALEVVGPLTVFKQANDCLQQSKQAGGYSIQIAATAAGVVSSDIETQVVASKALGPAVAHTVIIPGTTDVSFLSLDTASELKLWLAREGHRAERIGALCVGTLLLAEAGLLNGRPAVTHWSFAKSLQSTHPHIQVEEGRLFNRHGNAWTCAGVTAGIDLALAFVEEDFGLQLATEVAKELVLFTKRPGAEPQLSAHLNHPRTISDSIERAKQWVLSNSHRRVRTADIAKAAAMSERNFVRVFQRETGRTPSEYLCEARFEAATRDLAGTSHPIKAIASRCGFGAYTSMRKVFLSRVGVSPRAYRVALGRGDVDDDLDLDTDGAAG